MITSRLLNAIFYAIDYEALQISTARRIPLAEISEDAELIPDLLAEADSKPPRLSQQLATEPGIRGADESPCSLVSSRFSRRPVVTGNRRRGKGSGLVVSKESYDKAVAEYDDLVTKQIPENSKAIGLS